MTIAVLGTLDTKGAEHAYVAECLRQRGHEPLLIDVGTGAAPTVVPHLSRAEVAKAGQIDLDALMARHDRGECVTAMSEAAAVCLSALESAGKIDGVISLGGGGGTAIAAAAMRALPIGFPKLIVSTLASGNTSHYVGTKDIVMFPSVVDVAGLNRLSKLIFARAASAISGMVEAVIPAIADEKPIIVASMFGNTTDCVNLAKEILEKAGFEVLVFHATGAGGRTMEALIDSGMVAGVLDITTTEWADELVGGVLSAGPDRPSAAGRACVPAIVGPGCLDMVNFGERDSVPACYADRQFYVHNPQVTLMRTNARECARLGEIMAEKLNAYASPLTVMLPTKAISIISAEGQPFHDPEADQALFDTLKRSLRAGISVIEMASEVNAPEFATACAEQLLALLREGGDSSTLS